MLAASLPYSESTHVILISCKNYLHGNTSMGVRPINWSSESVKVTHKINCHTGLPRFSGGHVWMGELDHKES